MNFKLRFLFFVILTILVSIGSTSLHATSGGTFTFNPDQITFDAGDGYNLVKYTDEHVFYTSTTGEPYLPRYNFKVLVPPGASFSGLTITGEDLIPIRENFTPYPGQELITAGTKSSSFTPPKLAIYTSDTLYPNRPTIQYLGKSEIRGYTVFEFALDLFKVNPVQKQLYFVKNISYSIWYGKEKNAAKKKYPKHRFFERSVLKMVTNPDAFTDFYEVENQKSSSSSFSTFGVTTTSLQSPLSGDVDWLIITARTPENGAILNAFSSYAAHRASRTGLAYAMEAVEDIDTLYSGATTQIRIKRCIEDYVKNHNTAYVLLGGDNTIVPDQDCYGYVTLASGAEEDNTIPADLFYACLDGVFDWNADADNRVGEITIDGADLSPDVAIGRLPINSSSQVTDYQNKVDNYYQKGQTVFAEKLLLTGVRLFTEGDANYKTENFLYLPSFVPYWKKHQKITFYDNDPGVTVDVTNFTNKVNESFNFIHMATHGNYNLWSMESGTSFSSTYALNLNNDAGIIASIACNTNGFDMAEPSLGEALIRNSHGGGIIYAATSRTNLDYDSISMEGPCWGYNKTFFRNLFLRESDGSMMDTGQAFMTMKQSLANSTADNVYCWVHFGLNLMGDPTIAPIVPQPPFYIYHPNNNEDVRGITTIRTSVPASPTITKVVFRVDGLIYTDTTAPFEYPLDTRTVSDGQKTITAESYSGTTLFATDEVKLLVDNTPPVCAINNPANNGYVRGQITINTYTSDNSGIATVEFYLDGNLLGRVPNNSYPLDTTALSETTHTIQCIAYDRAGNWIASPVHTFTVDNTLPTLSITNPASGSVVTGDVPVRVTTSDGNGITKVEFFIDEVPVYTDTNAPYEFFWSSSWEKKGSHTITVTTYDLAQNSTTKQMTVTVAEKTYTLTNNNGNYSWTTFTVGRANTEIYWSCDLTAGLFPGTVTYGGGAFFTIKDPSGNTIVSYNTPTKASGSFRASAGTYRMEVSGGGVWNYVNGVMTLIQAGTGTGSVSNNPAIVEPFDYSSYHLSTQSVPDTENITLQHTTLLYWSCDLTNGRFDATSPEDQPHFKITGGGVNKVFVTGTVAESGCVVLSPGAYTVSVYGGLKVGPNSVYYYGSATGRCSISSSLFSFPDTYEKSFSFTTAKTVCWSCDLRDGLNGAYYQIQDANGNIVAYHDSISQASGTFKATAGMTYTAEIYGGVDYGLGYAEGYLSYAEQSGWMSLGETTANPTCSGSCSLDWNSTLSLFSGGGYGGGTFSWGTNSGYQIRWRARCTSGTFSLDGHWLPVSWSQEYVTTGRTLSWDTAGGGNVEIDYVKVYQYIY